MIIFGFTFVMFEGCCAYEQILNSIGCAHLNATVAATHCGIFMDEGGVPPLVVLYKFGAHPNGCRLRFSTKNRSFFYDKKGPGVKTPGLLHVWKKL